MGGFSTINISFAILFSDGFSAVNFDLFILRILCE